MKTYILIPAWRIDDFSSENKEDWKQWCDIPYSFIKIFHSKKDIEKYLNENNILRGCGVADSSLNNKLYNIMLTSIFEKYKDDMKLALKKSNQYKDVIWWVITCDDDITKENRIGIMQKLYDKKTDSLYWKYCTYFGGKCHPDALLFEFGYR